MGAVVEEPFHRIRRCPSNQSPSYPENQARPTIDEADADWQALKTVAEAIRDA
jgi:hypothetical protein